MRIVAFIVVQVIQADGHWPMKLEMPQSVNKATSDVRKSSVVAKGLHDTLCQLQINGLGELPFITTASGSELAKPSDLKLLTKN